MRGVGQRTAATRPFAVAVATPPMQDIPAANDNSKQATPATESNPAAAMLTAQTAGPTVPIFGPAPIPGQGGPANQTLWLLEFALQSAPKIDPSMGWTNPGEVLRQRRLRFSTKEDVVAVGEWQAWRPIMIGPHECPIRPRGS